MSIVLLIIGFCLGIALCMFLNAKKTKKIGTLVIDQSDPDSPPYLFVELNDHSWYAKLHTMKEVKFDVIFKNYISQ